MTTRIKPPISAWVQTRPRTMYTFHDEPLERQSERDLHFLSLAFVTTMNLSKDPNTRAGALISSSDGRQLSTGYNGFPAGIEERPEFWERPKKYEFVVHAELNAILNAPFDTQGATIYTTFQPCHRCLVHILNAGISRIVYYGYDPKYPDGKYPLVDQDVWDACIARVRLTVVPKNPLIESLREIYCPGN